MFYRQDVSLYFSWFIAFKLKPFFIYSRILLPPALKQQ